MELRAIRTMADYESALAAIQRLFFTSPDTDEGERLDLLTTLVQAYDAVNFPIPETCPIKAMRYIVASCPLPGSAN